MNDLSISQDRRRYLIDTISLALPSLSDYQLALLLLVSRACKTCDLQVEVSLSNSKLKKNYETQKTKTQK